MKHGMIEYGRTRRQIRKVNREMRVDQNYSKRTLVKIILIVAALLFVLIETFGLNFAKKLHDREVAKNLSETATIELSLINTSLITSDQTMFKNAHRQYQDTLTQLNSNSFVVSEHADLLKTLNDYEVTLAEEEKNAHLIKLHTTITMLQKELQETDLKKVSTESMNDTKESFEDFRDSLESLDDARFKETIAELTDYSNKIIKLIDRTSVCVGTCTSKTINARLYELNKILDEYQVKLSDCDTKISKYFSPAELVESLKMLQ